MTGPYRPDDIKPEPVENRKVPWPGLHPERPAHEMRAGEQFYRQDEDDQARYMRLYLGATAENNGRQPGLYFVNSDVLDGAEGEFFADHIAQGEMVRKVWTGNS